MGSYKERKHFILNVNKLKIVLDGFALTSATTANVSISVNVKNAMLFKGRKILEARMERQA